MTQRNISQALITLGIVFLFFKLFFFFEKPTTKLTYTPLCSAPYNQRIQILNRSWDPREGKISGTLEIPSGLKIPFSVQEISERYSSIFDWRIIETTKGADPWYARWPRAEKLFGTDVVEHGFYKRNDHDYFVIRYSEGYRCVVHFYPETNQALFELTMQAVYER